MTTKKQETADTKTDVDIREDGELRTDVAVTPDCDSTLDFLQRWNMELTTFYAQRYLQYAALPMRLFSCRSVAEFEALQKDFLEQLAVDYRREAAKLSWISGAAAEDLDASAVAEYAARLQKAQQDAAAILEQAKAQADRILMSAENHAARLSEPQAEEVRKRA